jgi:hypothetical protein
LPERPKPLSDDSTVKEPRPWRAYPLFAIIFVAVFVVHLPLLRLPYFWDEAGYYIPAARDIFLNGALIPNSTLSNAHPPLVLLWIALWWKVWGYAAVVTRTAMLVIAAFSLVGVFRLAEHAANRQVAIASTLCTGLYSVFFAQSSLAQVDLAAAGLTFWGLAAYVENKDLATACWFALAALAKETAILAPLALAVWEMIGFFLRKNFPLDLWLERREFSNADAAAKSRKRIGALLFPVLPLACWYGYHKLRTGYVFGNPEFFRYNVAATLNPLRFLLAFAMRLWQICGYLHLWILTAPALIALWKFAPQSDAGHERRAIGIPQQIVFYVVIAIYVVAMALIGGAVLARYMLPVIPLVVILCVSTLRRRLRQWAIAIACVSAAFVAAWFWNPPYGFSPEDNLAYRDYAILHENAEQFLEARYPMARVLTAWPASDEITRPWLGYISRPMQAVRVENFALEAMITAAQSAGDYDVALIFSTKYEPPPEVWDLWRTQADLRMRWKSRFFGYHKDLPPGSAAKILGGQVVFSERHHGQWIAVIEMNSKKRTTDF